MIDEEFFYFLRHHQSSSSSIIVIINHHHIPIAIKKTANAPRNMDSLGEWDGLGLGN
tara:strand:+ start:218 stop:388 length:171 start_codon:yes stop_codon:yes gene_type:complete